MTYQPLAKLFHMDATSTRFQANGRLAQQRRNSLGAFRLGVTGTSGELFLATPSELSLLSESILAKERQVSLHLNSLPSVAQGALIRDLVVNEVVSTNKIESIHSTKRQIADILESATETDHPASNTQDTRRFRELALLYLGLSQDDVPLPRMPEDIRSLYDKVMAQEPLPDSDRPDGRLFRKGRVEIIGSGMRTLHEGLYPEQAIYDGLGRMIEVASSANLPRLYGAILAHYLFEYIHPFYDGNGRTGRYLLALYLSRVLSLPTVLSLSRSISQNKDRYYRAFRQAEDPLNHGELTFFVMDLLEMVQGSQLELVSRLDESRTALDTATERLTQFMGDAGLAEKETELLEFLLQIALFATFPTSSLRECADYLGLGTQQTRKYVARLEDRGLVSTVRKRPLAIALGDTARKLLL